MDINCYSTIPASTPSEPETTFPLEKKALQSFIGKKFVNYWDL
jgi:hypothetical protein